MELIKAGPYADVYLLDDMIIKKYSYSLDISQNVSASRSCFIAQDLFESIPQYVPHVFKVVERPSGVTITMAKVEGISLRDYIKQERNLPDTLETISSLKAALYAMHKASYGHYDFHYNNIIVKEDRTVVLIDFDTSDDVNMKDPADNETPLIELDFYFLKCHIARLIFTGITSDTPCDTLKEVKNFTVANILQYDKYPKTAQAVYDMFTQLGTTSYENED